MYAAPVSEQRRGGVRFDARTRSRLKKRTRGIISGLIRNRSIGVRSGAVRSRDYLDIGCGSNPHPRFINLNYDWNRGIDICWDVGRGIPLRDGSMQGVFSEHCLEHLSLDTTDQVLKECYRMLKPGGAVRIVVPDGELYLTGYAEIRAGGDGRLPFSEHDGYEGIYTPIMSVNRI